MVCGLFLRLFWGGLWVVLRLFLRVVFGLFWGLFLGLFEGFFWELVLKTTGKQAIGLGEEDEMRASNESRSVIDDHNWNRKKVRFCLQKIGDMSVLYYREKKTEDSKRSSWIAPHQGWRWGWGVDCHQKELHHCVKTKLESDHVVYLTERCSLSRTHQVQRQLDWLDR